MSTWYLGLQPLQEPADIGLDEDSGLVQASCNFLVTKRASTTTLQEIVTVLEAAGVGTEGTDIFGSSKAPVPTGAANRGPYIHLLLRGGTEPLGTHNEGVGAYRRPSVQVLVRAASWAAAEAKALAAYAALVGVRNELVSA